MGVYKVPLATQDGFSIRSGTRRGFGQEGEAFRRDARRSSSVANGLIPSGSSETKAMATTNVLRMVGRSLVPNDVSGIAPEELDEWFESLDDVLVRYGPQRLQELLVNLQERAYLRGVTLPFTANTPYVNTIPADQQPRYPGNIEIERRIKSIIRWNAMAMVSRANTKYPGVGGHISTFASSATLYEVGMNHFFHAPTADRTPATSSISRVTLRQACTGGRSSRAG